MFYIRIVVIYFVFACTAAIAKDTLKLGMSAALSGPARHIGSDLHFGADTYFSRYSQGRIELKVLDDGYEPARTVSNTRLLLFNHQVDALFSYMGTPTSYAIMPLIQAERVPLLTPFTGAEFLRTNNNPLIFNMRTSYFAEAEQQITHLLEKNHKRIALLIQADEFGLSAEEGLLKALKEKQRVPLMTARFRRNTDDITHALEASYSVKADAICMVGTYEPLAAFINQANEKGYHPQYTSMSFVSSSALYELIKNPARIFVSEVVPAPNECELAICQRFTSDMKARGVDTPNRVQLEGYLNAYAFDKASQSCTTKNIRECIVPALKSELKKNPELQQLFRRNGTDVDKTAIYHSVFQQ